MIVHPNVRLAFLIIGVITFAVSLIIVALPYMEANRDWDDLKKSQYQTAGAVLVMSWILFFSLWFLTISDKDKLSIIEKYQLGQFYYDSKGKLHQLTKDQIAARDAQKAAEKAAANALKIAQADPSAANLAAAATTSNAAAAATAAAAAIAPPTAVPAAVPTAVARGAPAAPTLNPLAPAFIPAPGPLAVI